MNDSRINLPKHIVTQIVTTARRYPQIEKVILFGSWALGNAKPGSDIDLALSEGEVQARIVLSFHAYLEEETTIPHFFDVIHLETLENDALKQHILEKGVTIYSITDPAH